VPLGSFIPWPAQQLARLMIRNNVRFRDDELLHMKQTDEGFVTALAGRSSSD
jgi:hypothetical protein